jgi:hypothetical protein
VHAPSLSFGEENKFIILKLTAIIINVPVKYIVYYSTFDKCKASMNKGVLDADTNTYTYTQTCCLLHDLAGCVERNCVRYGSMFIAPAALITYNCDFDTETQRVVLLTFALRALTGIEAMRKACTYKSKHRYMMSTK